MQKYYRVLLIILIGFFLIVSFLGGFYLRDYSEKTAHSVSYLTKVYNKEEGKPKNLDFAIFWDAWKNLETQYLNRDKLDQEKLIYGSISGLVKSLGDPYSTFLNPKQTKNFIEDISGSFEGIGIEIGIRNDVLTVISPIKGTPAEKAGLEAGDKIIKIDNVTTDNIALEEAVNKIRGPHDTTVVLTIFRENKTSDYKITRGVIQIPIVEWQKIGDDKIAWIKLYYFSENLNWKFRQIANEITLSGVNKIALDLRNNPGGILDQAIEIASYFLPKDAVVTIQDNGNINKLELKSKGYVQFQNAKVVILINEGSASASEILAGALRDNRNIKLIGEKTFGKGTVQQLFDLKDGSVIKLTIARWLTPKGYSISDQGLEPDIKVVPPQPRPGGAESGKKMDEDPQLDKAIEILKNI